MSEDELSTFSKAIKEELGSLSTPIPKQRCMYKVHEQLRKVNEEAYKPVLLAIGPYHEHGTIGQGFMEEHKLRYLQQMLARTNTSVEPYMTALMELEGKSREYYAECTSQISPHEFAKMMLLDGCFIIELFRKYEIYRKERDSKNTLNDPIFKMEWVLPRIARDLLLFENQLPFFVLVELFRMSESRNSREHLVDMDVESSNSTVPSICKLSHLALNFFHSYLPFKLDVDASNYNSKEKIKHLVCLMHEALSHKALVPSLPELVWKRLEFGFSFKIVDVEHLLGLIHATIIISILDTEIDHEAKEVKKAGIFKHLFGQISKTVIPLLEKRKDNQEPLLRRKSLEGDSEENMEAETDQDWERESIPYCSEFKEAGVTLKIAKKIKDHVNEIQAYMAGIEEYYVNRHSATELLEEFGIEFMKSENDNMFFIKFNNGLMEVSPLIIDDQTETFLRNLIAYEQYCDMDKSLNYVTNYVCFMDGLINSPKDVELLRQSGIIPNYLVDDVATSTMFNKLGHNINSSTDNIYSTTSTNMIIHCGSPRSKLMAKWNKWMAILRRDYFNSPWALISFLAAVILLALTIVQTIFSIIP